MKLDSCLADTQAMKNDIGDYRITKKLEQTNFAHVYKASSEEHGICALKIASQTSHNDLVAREFQILSQFKHPHIVSVFDYGLKDDGRAFFSLEFVNGKPIHRCFRGLSQNFIQCMIQILGALGAFHAKGYVHCDLKPEHILFDDEKNRAVLIDFGFAGKMTHKLPPAGTLRYMAPEVLKGTTIDHRSDLYSLGCIFYRVLARRHPHGTFKSIQNIPQEVNSMISRLVSNEPVARPNIHEIQEIVAAHMKDQPRRQPTHKINLPHPGFVEATDIIARLADARGMTIMVTGEPGVGKTRLLHEMRYKYLMNGNHVLYHSARHKKMLHEALCDLTSTKHTDTHAFEDKYQLFEILTQALIEHSRDTDLVIMIDDCNELDDYDLSLFRYVSHGIHKTRVLLIGTTHTDMQLGNIPCEVLRLRPFDIDKTQLFLTKTFFALVSVDKDAKGAEGFAEWLQRQSGGNPLFLTAILTALYDSNILFFSANQWQVKIEALEKALVPSKLATLLRRQVQSLADHERSILKVLGCADFSLEQSIIDSIVGTDTLVFLEHLKNKGFIRENRQGTKRAFTLANQVLYKIMTGNISARTLKRISKAIIHAIEKNAPHDPHYVPLLSRLCENTDARKKARQYLEASALQAKDLHDYAHAITFFQKLLSYTAPTDTKERARICLEVADLYNRIGTTKAALGYYKKALALKNRELTRSIYSGMGRAYSAMSDYTKAETFLRKALFRFKKHPEREYIRTLNCLAYVLLARKRFKEAQTILKQSLSLSQQIQDVEMTAETFYYQAVCNWFRREFEKGLETAHNALAFADKHKLHKQHSYVANLISSLYLQIGNTEESQKYLLTAIEKLKEMNLSTALAGALANQASLYYSQGRLNKAREIFETALVRASQTENQAVRYNTLSNLGLLSEDLCEFDDGIEFHKQALAIMPDDVMPTYSLAMIFLKQGELEKSYSVLKRSSYSQKAPLLLIGLARVYHLRGQKHSGTFLTKGLKATAVGKSNRFLKIATYLAAALAYYERGDAQRSIRYAKKLNELAFPGSKEHSIGSALIKINTFKLTGNHKINIETEKKVLKSMGCLFDYAYLTRAMIESLSDAGKYDILVQQKALQELASLNEILHDVGAVTELNNVRKLEERLYPAIVTVYESVAMSQRYLDTLSKLAELISSSLGSDHFMENLLDLVIAATQAERGAVFIAGGKKMELAVGKNIDHTTINDATELSRSAVTKIEKDNVIFIRDARSDPQYNIKKSVMLHQIRSILCIPLTIAGNVIGAIYLDSRMRTDVFGPRDIDFLTTVAKILASIIEKSQLFKKMSEENVWLKSNIIQEIGSGYLKGRSRNMQRVYALVDDVAESNAPVLILGETGTGKGMIARLVHQKSKRKEHKFLTINCGTIPETLLESELFGHEKGAYTGAYTDKKGLLEEAHGGTVFLDEITNTSASFQAKILEAIEEKVIRRIGETATRNIDVRFVFATNKDIEIEVEEGRFRRDLYYRMNVFSIEIPPLRERRDDIPLLAQFFLERYRKELNKGDLVFTKDAVQQLKDCIWQGNIRELQNTIERAVTLTKKGVITSQDLGLKHVGHVQIAPMTTIKKQAIVEALNVTNLNIKKAAELLGVSRRTIERYVKKYNIIT